MKIWSNYCCFLILRSMAAVNLRNDNDDIIAKCQIFYVSNTVEEENYLSHVL